MPSSPALRVLFVAGAAALGCHDGTAPLGGPVDGGAPDEPPAAEDAGALDAGAELDVGARDAGRPDAGGGPDVGAGDAGPPDAGGLRPCEAAGEWCWARGAPILVIDGPSRDALFAGGRGGTLLRWAGERWARVELPTSADVTDLFVESARSVWIAAGGLWRFDGARVRPVSGRPACAHLSGSGPGDVWAYGGCPVMRHDGEAWTVFPIPGDSDTEVFSLLARGADEAWASVTGELDATGLRFHERFFRFDGARWRAQGPFFDRLSPAIRYSMIELEGRVVARDLRRGTNLVLDGQTWVSRDDLPVPARTEDEWVVYARRGGFLRVTTRCAAFPELAGRELRRSGGAVALADGARFCVGFDGGLRRSSASGWSVTPAGAFSGTATPERWGSIPPQLWAFDAELAWGSGPNNVLRVQTQFDRGNPTGERLSHFDGERWRLVDERTSPFWDFASAGGEAAWVIAGSRLFRFDGSALVEAPVPPDLGVARWMRVHTVDDGASFFTASAGGVSALSDQLLLRHEAGTWTVERRWEVGAADHVTFEFTDLAGRTGGELLIGARSPSAERLVIDRGARWSQIGLGAEVDARGEAFALAGDRLWIDGQERRVAALASEPLDVAPLRSASMGWGFRQPRLWVGPDRVWVVSRGRALYRRR